MLTGGLEETFSQLGVNYRWNTAPTGLQAEQRHGCETVGDLTRQDSSETVPEGFTMNHQFFIVFCMMVAA